MRLIEQFFRIVAPSNCLMCRTEGSLLCAWCIEDALPQHQPRCYRCNALTSESSICANCKRKTALRSLWIRTEYSDTAKNLVHMMKFKYSGEAADILATELVNTIPALSPETIVVAVPTITSHVRQRGFDHTKRIVARISAMTPYSSQQVLVRMGQHRQVGSSRKQRLTEVTNSFRVKSPFVVKNCPVVLVDDVLTTGATLEAAAKALRQAGASRVDAVVFARAR